jgi:hypothetical protein
MKMEPNAPSPDSTSESDGEYAYLDELLAGLDPGELQYIADKAMSMSAVAEPAEPLVDDMAADDEEIPFD